MEKFDINILIKKALERGNQEIKVIFKSLHNNFPKVEILTITQLNAYLLAKIDNIDYVEVMELD